MTGIFFGARAQLVTSFEPGQPPQSEVPIRQALADWAHLGDASRARAIMFVSDVENGGPTRVLGSAQIADLAESLQRA